MAAAGAFLLAARATTLNRLKLRLNRIIVRSLTADNRTAARHAMLLRGTVLIQAAFVALILGLAPGDGASQRVPRACRWVG